MVAVGRKILNSSTIDNARLVQAKDSLLKDTKFVDAISTGTSQKFKVDIRITHAISSIE